MTPQNLDQLIDSAHAELERVEAEAKQLEARLLRAGVTPPTRRYGKPVDLSQNLTAQGLLQVRDPALASYLGFGSDIARKREEEQQARILQAERMRLQTEQARAQNQAAAAARYKAQLAGVNPVNGRRLGQ